jgi:drug/metabolite transporter (DMT)-like permease
MTASETSAAILATSTFCIIVAGFCTLPFGWIMPSAIDIAFLAATGLLVGAAHFCMIETYRYAEAALAAPYKYFTMVWAVLFGFVIWGDLPDGWMIAGAVLVIGSGLYILHREARRSPSKDRRE